MSDALNHYYAQIHQKLRELEQQRDVIDRAAEMMFDTVCNQRNLFVFGASHAGDPWRKR